MDLNKAREQQKEAVKKVDISRHLKTIDEMSKQGYGAVTIKFQKFPELYALAISGFTVQGLDHAKRTAIIRWDTDLIGG